MITLIHMAKTLGEKLKFYRERKFQNMGLRKVAGELKMNYVYLHRIEKDVFAPSVKLIQNLSKKYGLNEDEEIELFKIAKKLHLHPKITKHLQEHLNEAEQFFRKITKQ